MLGNEVAEIKTVIDSHRLEGINLTFTISMGTHFSSCALLHLSHSYPDGRQAISYGLSDRRYYTVRWQSLTRKNILGFDIIMKLYIFVIRKCYCN